MAWGPRNLFLSLLVVLLTGCPGSDSIERSDDVTGASEKKRRVEVAKLIEASLPRAASVTEEYFKATGASATVPALFASSCLDELCDLRSIGLLVIE